MKLDILTLITMVIIAYDHPTKGHQRTKYELYPDTRHHDRFNWRNTLSTNRILTHQRI